MRSLVWWSRRTGLAGVEMTDGRVVARTAVFIRPGNQPHADGLLCGLGCEVNEAGFVTVDATGRTSVFGVWAAGNVVDPRAQVITSAGAGSAAAIAINATWCKCRSNRQRKTTKPLVGRSSPRWRHATPRPCRRASVVKQFANLGLDLHPHRRGHRRDWPPVAKGTLPVTCRLFVDRKPHDVDCEGICQVLLTSLSRVGTLPKRNVQVVVSLRNVAPTAK